MDDDVGGRALVAQLQMEERCKQNQEKRRFFSRQKFGRPVTLRPGETCPILAVDVVDLVTTDPGAGQ